VRRSAPYLSSITAVALALLYLPLMSMIAASFNAARYGLLWQGFSARWYEAVLRDPRTVDAIWNTVVLATLSTGISTVLGTCLAIGLDRYPWPPSVRTAIGAGLALPVMAPDIMFAIGLLLAFRVFCQLSSAFDLGMSTLVLGHVSFQISFVALVVRARLDSLGSHLQEAARDLYGGVWFIFRRVTFPLVAPSVVSGAMLAFMLSLDDAIVSFFIRGTTRTVPTFILTEVKRGVSPQLHALATLFLLITVVLVIGLETLVRPRKASHEPPNFNTRMARPR